MRKRMLCGTLAAALVMTAAGCAADPLAQDRLPEKVEETPVQRSETYPELWQEDGSLFDDFTNGVNPEIWTVPDTKWGYDNRGVTSRNVSYTKDGILVLAANGDLYKGDIMGMSDGGQPATTGTRTGAIVRSHYYFGPGSYEVKMKVMPRFGGCSAIWTFFNDGSRNHEIDIELPGPSKYSFDYAGMTNYITEEKMDSVKTKTIANNDGEWHTYRFDWHTDPVDPRIDYYIDGEKLVTSRRNIPTVKGYFTIGVWFPKGWAGVADFERNYMYVDWFRFTPYDETGWEANPRENLEFAMEGLEHTYPSQTSPLPVNNFFANGSFEDGLEGWTAEGEAAASTEHATDGKGSAAIGKGGSLAQLVSGISSKVKYTLTVNTKNSTKKTDAVLEVEYTDAFGNSLLEKSVVTEKLENTGTWQHTLPLTPPSQAKKVRVTLRNNGGGTLWADEAVLVPAGPAEG